MNIKKVFMIFYLISGLKENYDKSYIYGINVSEEDMRCRAEELRCKVGILFIKYFSLVLGGKSYRMELWDSVVEYME